MPKGTAQPPEMPSRQAAGPVSPTDMTIQPPHDAVAEQAVLGSCMHGPDVIDEVRTMLDAADFYRPQHETIWRALLALRGEDKPTDPITVSDFLTCQGDINRVGGVVYVHQLYGAPPSASHAAYYADIVRRTAALRRLREHGIRTVQRVQEPGADPDEIRSEIETDLGAERERALASGSGRLSRYLVDGWRFVTETGADKEPLWGTREKTAWASGESLMIVGAPGVGKTTLAHQVVLARIGLQGTVLDMPVAPSKRVLYLAMDRPQQIAKAMARRIGRHDEAILRDRLVVWQGPLPTSLDREPDLLADLAAAHQADTIVIDSLKDAVSTLVDDALAVAFNNARQRAIRNGVEVMELHHQRKSQEGTARDTRPSLDRVYGSTWITSGAGSVLFISGEAGDPAVTLHHLKTPTGEIGPLQLIHDHAHGTTTLDPALDPITILRAAPGGLGARDLATAQTGESNPGRAAVEKARRALDSLVKAGLATKADGLAGGSGGGQQARYYASARHIAAVC
ncbi:DnaB-like helicase N-terminal domain-containing protein [Streptomyces sp. UNOC14_S4]|uniref:DnaB-like helicase N-terminal domain-containing protein n=1 Tax=Streptomyces sp. UNOC14_S4 TaxID=2872340 RepID=UPI001E4E51C8|nr:DnaB-like helicase N-terminal domain-containing protein [Streptomyces sp. UNOC14_S4]